jgi:urease accessory protein UreE
MITKVRRVALVLATSAGIIAATTTAAHALGNNHCEARLPH